MEARLRQPKSVKKSVWRPPSLDAAAGTDTIFR